MDGSHWDTSDATTTQWLELKDTEASWEIGTERRVQLGSRFIDPKQMFSVLTHLAMFGWVSWFAINRATGSKNDNHDAADVLALLVMSGLARPESDWQNKHEATDRAVEIAALERLNTSACVVQTIAPLNWCDRRQRSLRRQQCHPMRRIDKI
jgi:hypothetical protein